MGNNPVPSVEEARYESSQPRDCAAHPKLHTWPFLSYLKTVHITVNRTQKILYTLPHFCNLRQCILQYKGPREIRVNCNHATLRQVILQYTTKTVNRPVKQDVLHTVVNVITVQLNLCHYNGSIYSIH